MHNQTRGKKVKGKGGEEEEEGRKRRKVKFKIFNPPSIN